MTSSSVVYITGASKGIGLGVARALLADGHRVVSYSRSLTPELVALSEVHSANLRVLHGDVTDRAESMAAIRRAQSIFGKLDALVLNVGIPAMGSVADTPVDEWRRVFEINTFSMVPMLNVALPILREHGGGRVVFVTSHIGTEPFPGMAATAASKAAVNSIARSIAVEEPNVITIAIHPGVVPTPGLETCIETAPPDVSNALRAAANAPRGGKGPVAVNSAEDVGRRLAWLALHAPKELSGKFFCHDDDEITTLTDARA